MAATRAHGQFLAAEVGELAGVSGTTIGQWARWGYIRSSASDGEPRVYGVEDVGEATMVAIAAKFAGSEEPVGVKEPGIPAVAPVAATDGSFSTVV